MGSRAGILQYLGETKFAPGNWCGVQLDEPTGKNDGTVDGVQYVKSPLFLISCNRPRNVFIVSRLLSWILLLLGISIVHRIMVYLFLWRKYHCLHWHVNRVCRVPVPRNHLLQSAQWAHWAALHQQIRLVCE